MSKQNRCVAAGAVVSPSRPMPNDPSEHAPPCMLAAVGCNRLRCGQCGAMVRWHDALHCPEDASARVEELYAAADWGALDFTAPTTVGRLYACRCIVFVAPRTTLMIDPDPDPMVDASLPWRCDGHPLASLPVDVDGVQIGKDTDLAALVARNAEGELPEAADPTIKQFPVEWLFRLRGRLEGLPLASKLEGAIVDSAIEGSELARGQALQFFRGYADSPFFDSLLELIRDDGPLAGTFPLLSHGDRIPISALELLVDRLELDASGFDAVLATTRSILADTTLTLDEDQLDTLAAIDGEWLASNAAALFARPERIRMLPAFLDAFYVADREELIVIAVTALLQTGNKKLAQGIRKWVKSGSHQHTAYGFTVLQALRKRR